MPTKTKNSILEACKKCVALNLLKCVALSLLKMGCQKLTYYPRIEVLNKGAIKTLTSKKSIKNVCNYTVFGVQLDGRTQGSSGRFGFNSMEKDDEIKGYGNSYNFGARMYDARVGIWTSRDYFAGSKSAISPYSSFRGNPIFYVDPDGRDEFVSIRIIDERTGKTTIIVPKANRISKRVMTTGDGSNNVHSNYYYDFETQHTLRIDKDGKYHVSKQYKILTDNGVKDVDLAYGSENVKPKYYNKSESDGINPLFLGDVELEGSGGTQNSGFILVSKDGEGASPTRQRALTDAEEREIGALLDTFGAGSAAKGVKTPEAMEKAEKIKSGVEKLNELTGGELLGPDDSKIRDSDPVVVSVPNANQQGTLSPLTHTLDRATAKKTFNGTYSEKKDTLYVGGKK